MPMFILWMLHCTILLFGHTSKVKVCSHEQFLASLRREASLSKLARSFGSWCFFY